jgi:Flp pilus assembly protein TadG
MSNSLLEPQRVREVAMPVAPLPRAASPRCGVLARLWRQSHGTAAMEFAFLAPLLMLMLLGSIEIGRAVDMNRRFSMVTASLGDLVAREEWLGTTSSNASANLDSMMDAIERMMDPYDSTSLKLGVFQVRASPDDASDTRVDWSYSHNGQTVPAKCDKYTLPAGVVEKGGSVIVVESGYVYHPLFGDFVPGITGDMNWTDKSLHSPRNSCVDYVEGDNCSSLNCD